MSEKEKLAPVSDTEKLQQHDNLQNEETWGIGEKLSVLYDKKSIGNIDAQHDAKIIALKYLDDGYKDGKLQIQKGSILDVASFATIRNQLGKDFFDNMLYKYDVPYDEIVKLANDLLQADANKVEEMKNDLVRLLHDMHTDDVTEQIHDNNKEHATEAWVTPPKNNKKGKNKEGKKQKAENKEPDLPEKAVDSRVQVVSLTSKYNNAKQYDTFFEDRYADYKHAIQNQLKTPELAKMCPPAFTNSFARGVMEWWYDKVWQKIESYNAGKPEYKKASVDQIRKWLNCSPFDPKGRQEIGVTEDMTQLLKNLQTAKNDSTDQPITDLSTVPELMNFDSLTKFLHTPENYLPNTELCLTVDAEKITPFSDIEKTTLNTSLQKVVDAYEWGRRPSDIEKVMDAASPIMDNLSNGLEKAADYITSFVDKLKESGAREKIEKIFNLLFGEGGDLLDRLSEFNIMKESELGVERTVALNSWFFLCNTWEKSIDVLDKERTNAAKTWPLEEKDKEAVHDKMWEMLFKTDYLRTERNTSPRCKELQQTLWSAYTKMVGEWNDIYDLIAKNLLNETNYNEFISARGKWDANQAMGILEHSWMSPVIDEVSKDHNQDITSHKLYLKMILARMLWTKENAAWVVRAATNEIQKDINAKKLELTNLTKDINIRVDANKVYLDGIPSGEKIGIKIWTEEPVPYDHAQWVDITPLGDPPEFTFVKKQTDGTWSEFVRDEVLVVPMENVSVDQDKKSATITSLEKGDYLIKTDYKKESTTTPVEKQINLNVKGSLTHTFDTEKWTPTALQFKPKAGGLRQTIWQDKKVS
jgi:hypothetical protein